MTFANRIMMLLAGASLAGWAGSAQAEEAHAVPWQLGLSEPATPVAEFIVSFHHWLLYLITIVALFVLALLIYVSVKFNAKANPVPSKTTHNTLVEVLWTVIPIIILVVIAIPSFRLLYLERNIPTPDMTIKIIGNPSWNWTYEYPDLGLNDDGSAKASFTAFLKPKEEAGANWLLATDVPVVVPVGKIVKTIVTSDPEGIIHAWTVHAFGMKIDAVPGRLNEDWFQATREGTFYGQCSELCGKDHAFMPIEVHVVSQDKYDAWAKALLETGDASEAAKTLAALEAAPQTVAQK